MEFHPPPTPVDEVGPEACAASPLFFFVISSMQKCWKHNTKNSVIPPLRCASYLQFAQFGLLFIYGNILLPELIENKVLIPYPCAPK